MRHFPVLMCLAVLVLTSSCSHLATVSDDHGPQAVAETGPAEIFAEAQALYAEGDLPAAQKALSLLIGTNYKPEEVAQLNGAITEKLGRTAQASAADKTLLNDLQGKEREQLLRAASHRLSEIRSLMRNKSYAEAQLMLSPLLGTDLFPEEVAEIAAELNLKRLEAARAAAQAETERRAMDEVHTRLEMPATYGRTVVISKYSDPLKMPTGAMEDLINKKVTIVLEDAGVKELVQVLSKEDGLNIVADDALTEEKRLTISVHDVPLKELLSYIARNMGVAFHLGQNMIWVTESIEPPGTGPKLETRIIKIKHGFIPQLQSGGGDDDGFGGGGGGGEGDNDLEDVLEAFLTDSPDGATYRIFKNRNLLVIRDSLENLRVVEELVREFDHPPYQVLIEARFLNIAQEDLSELGFDITAFNMDREENAEGEEPTLTLSTLSASTTFEAFKNVAEGSNLTLTGILGNHTYEAVLHALETSGRTKTLSAPRVTVLNNQAARIRKGDTLYYFEEYDTETVDGGDNADTTVLVPSGSPTELELGITLDVRVSVGDNGRTVNLSLNPQVVQFQQWLNFLTTDDGDNGNNNANDDTQPGGLVSLPQVNESRVSTTLVVNSGETVVLGGMLENTVANTERKVPFLGDIPIVGYLFKHVDETVEPQHLLIFVTATVVSGNGEFLDIHESNRAN